MRYTRFEDLPVWKLAIELAVDVYELTAKPQFKSRYSLRDQIERAAVSVSNNIAEGFERGTNNELLAFLYISRGSAGEVRSMVCLFDRIPEFRELRSDFPGIKTKAESCSRQLKAWIQSIQDSSFKGERYVNSQTKRKAQAALERDQFMKELAEIRARGSQPHREEV
jgi:four helix bundle protein